MIVSFVLHSVYYHIYLRRSSRLVERKLVVRFLGCPQPSSGFPGDPAEFHELKIRSMTSSTPVPCLMLVKIVGPFPLMSFASLSMTTSDADTNGAMSIYWTVKSRT